MMSPFQRRLFISNYGYIGVFGVLFGLSLPPLGFILGILGYRSRKAMGLKYGASIFAMVISVLMTLVFIACLIAISLKK